MKKYKPSRNFLLSAGLLILTFFTVQGIIVPSILQTENLAQVASSIQIKRAENIYNIKPSDKSIGVFTFEYKFSKQDGLKDGKAFDAAIEAFEENKAGGLQDFGSIRDAWGYPVRENAFMKKDVPDRKQSRSIFNINKALAYDVDPSDNSIYNCRANSSVTGYFKAYFEDVELSTGEGYDDQTYGEGRIQEACQVLQDISELIMLDETNVTPDILFEADPDMPSGALAAASAYSGYYSVGPDNGSLHKHVISRQDPTPTEGDFDAFIITGFNGISWDVDSTLNQNTYDFYTVMYHEVMHTLGFRGLLPAVITSTNVPHMHNTFDVFSFRDVSLLNPFFDQTTSNLEVSVGAPSPWFITNDVVYRGVKNIINATPDGIRAVFSPLSWQQGSSLSHFDMTRTSGQTYVMNPSIGTNTERVVHAHEKEVLCHLGYQVDGLSGCEESTPEAEDDAYAIIDSNQICIKPLQNDTSFENSSLTINSLNVVNIESGDVLVYYLYNDCSGSVMPTPFGARSVKFTPAASQSTRILSYTNKDFASNRISMPTLITIDPSCNLNDLDEYVCNGDFEIGPYSVMTVLAIECDSFSDTYIPHWCQYWGSPDRFNGIGNNPLGMGQYIVRNVWLQGEGNKEATTTKLKIPLTEGQEYLLSFDYYPRVAEMTSAVFGLNNGPILGDPYILAAPAILPVPEQIIFDEAIDNAQAQWYHFEQTFTPDDSYEYLVMWGEHSGSQSGNNNFHYFDNISIKPVNSGTSELLGVVKGITYQDTNQNGNKDVNESGLNGIEIGLFQSGNQNPIQTTTTQDIPNLGEYEFGNLIDGTYYVALMGETIYPSVTEPGVSSDPFPVYSHMYSISVNGGQTAVDKDFGVGLNVGVEILGCMDPLALNYNPVATQNNGSCEYPVLPVDIQIKKTLIDSTLSLFDRFITWRIIVQNVGINNATNVLVKEIVPPGLIYHSNVTPSPNTYDSSVHILNIPALLAGGQTYIDITMKVPNSLKVCGVKTNIAVLHHLDQIDTNPNNNQDQASIKLQNCPITEAPQVKMR